MTENNAVTGATAHVGVLTAGECGNGCCTHEVTAAATDLVNRFEPGRWVWSVAASTVYVVEADQRDSLTRGSQVMVRRPLRENVFAVDASEIFPLPNPGETVCLNADGGPAYGVVLEVSPAEDGQVELAWAVGSRVRRETFPPAVLDIAATNVRVPDRDPSVVVLAQMLNNLDRQHTGHLDGLLDEAARWAIREEICHQFENYLEVNGLPIPEQRWTVHGTIPFEFTVSRSFRDDSDDVMGSITAEEVAQAVGVPENVVRMLEFEVTEAERND